MIDSLRTEIAEQKSRLDAVISERPQQHSVNLLREEIVEYKDKLETIISGQAQQKNIDFQREETLENDNNLSGTSPHLDDEDERTLHSLSIDIAKLKRNLQSISSL